MNGLSVFVPAYNEEKIIERNILKIREELEKTNLPFELVLVDDNSTDNTNVLCQKLHQMNPQIIHKRYANGPARRENLACALRDARYDYIAFMDMDLATDLSHLQELLAQLDKGADFAMGSRYKGIQPERTLFRSLISKGYNLFMQVYFGSKVCDHQCGFKAFKKQPLFSVLDDMGYEHTMRRGWFWDAELLIRAQKKGFVISEFPVAWRFGEKSSFRILREMRMIPYVLWLRWRLP